MPVWSHILQWDLAGLKRPGRSTLALAGDDVLVGRHAFSNSTSAPAAGIVA